MPLIFLLFFGREAQAVDIAQIRKVNAESICHQHLLNAPGRKLFFEDYRPVFSLAQAMQQLRDLKAQLSDNLALVETVPAPAVPPPPEPSGWAWLTSFFSAGPAAPAAPEPLPSVSNYAAGLRKAIGLINRLLIVETRFHKRAADVERRRKDRKRPRVHGHTEEYDDLLIRWLEIKTIGACVPFAVFLKPAADAKEDLPARALEAGEKALHEIETALSSLKSAPGEKSRPITAQLVDLIREGARSKTDTWEAAQALWETELTPAELRELLPAMLGGDFTPESMVVWYGYLASHEIPASVRVPLMRTAARIHPVSITQVRLRWQALPAALAKELPNVAFSERELAAAADLSFELGLDAELFAAVAAEMAAGTGEVPAAALLVLMLGRHRSVETLPVFQEAFQRLMGGRSAELPGLTPLVAAILVPSVLRDGVEGAFRDLAELQMARQWKDSKPNYSIESWAQLSVLAGDLGLTPAETAELAQRVFALRGKPLEAGRLMTVLSLVVQKAREKSDDPRGASDQDLLLFVSLPYLRAMLLAEDLR